MKFIKQIRNEIGLLDLITYCVFLICSGSACLGFTSWDDQSYISLAIIYVGDLASCLGQVSVIVM